MYTFGDSAGVTTPLVVVESTHVLGRTYAQRARARRKRRRKVMKRKFRNFRKKWRRWWSKNWSKFLKVMNKVGAMFLRAIPIVGPIVATVAETSVSAAITAGETVYNKIQAGKVMGEVGYEAFKAYMTAGAPEGVVGTIHRIQTKYELPEGYPAANLVEVPSPVVTEQLRRFEEFLKTPEVVRIMELEDRADQLPDDSLEQDAIEDQIEALEEVALPKIIAIEQALDEEYWRVYPPVHKADPRGGGKHAKPTKWGEKVQVWFTDFGDPWVKWVGDIEAAPEGTVADVWYATTGTYSAAAAHAMSTDVRDPVMARAARERDEAYGCCWEYKWNPYAKKRVWTKTDPGSEARAWARLSVLTALGKEVPDSIWEQLSGGVKTAKPLPPPEPWKACQSGAHLAKSGITQLQSTFNSLARERGLPTVVVDGKYNQATEDLLKRVFTVRGLSSQITSGVVRQNFEKMGYSGHQAKKWEDAIAYFKRTLREQLEGLRGPEAQAQAQGAWRGEGTWLGHACEIYFPGQYEAAKQRYDRYHRPKLETRAFSIAGRIPLAAIVPPQMLPVKTLIAPTTPPQIEKKGLPGWAWGLIGVGGVVALGGAAYGISQVAAKAGTGQGAR